MPKFRIESPDGRVFDVEGPEGSTAEQALAQVQASYKQQAAAPVEKPDNMGALGNIGMGALKGAADVGATLLKPIDYLTGTTDRRQRLGDFFKEQADPESLAFKGGELGADIAATAGAGGVLAKFAKALGGGSKLVSALESGGFKLGSPAATTTGGKVADAALRTGAGAVVGGTSAGLIDPESAGTGSVIGAALPGAVKAAGTAGAALANKVSPEVRALYDKAKALGIDIPADRLVNSRLLNAASSSLNYVPLSGRAATEERMVSQLDRALSRTFGQDSDNVTASLRKAQTALGDKFDLTLKGNKVLADDELVDALSAAVSKADRTLTKDGIRIIGKQVDEILGKVGADGKIDGEAAYIIKRELDDIARGSGTEANAARDVKIALMDALNRSLGPQEAAKFAKVRQQYGNMLALENIAQNGAEGGVSVARLANMKNINNAELQDLADIAAQFVKTREGPHGAAQRVFTGAALGVGAGATGMLPALAVGATAGRAANMALNSNTLKSLLLRPDTVSGSLAGLERPEIRSLIYDAVANRGSP